MIEIRTFAGHAADLAALTRSTWTASYDGHMIYPTWSSEYFDWQLIQRQEPDRDFLIAAYDGQQLVGCLLAEPLPFHLHGDAVSGTMGGWLSVSHEYRGHGIAQRLATEQERRHREHGMQFQLGFGYYGARESAGPRFWKRRTRDTRLAGRLGFCVRILDRPAVRSWCLSRWERWGLSAWRPFHRRPHGSDGALSPYMNEHLDACLQLVQNSTSKVELTYAWTSDRLQHQLTGSRLPRSFVATQDGTVRGLVNYYLLEMQGRTSLKVAVIDLLVLPPRQARQFVNAALAEMVADGAQLALILRLQETPVLPLLQCGFLPLPADTWLVTTHLARPLELRRTNSLHVTWR